MRSLLAVVALSLALVVLGAGCAGGRADTGAVPDSARLAPKGSLAYVTVVTDEASAQWRDADRLLDLVPGGSDRIADLVRDSLAGQGLTWERDVAPALGPEVVLVVTAGRRPVVLTKPDSRQALDALVARSGERSVQGTVDGWTALAERQSDLDELRTGLAQGTLLDDDSFTESMRALPEEALVRAWADTSRLTEDLGTMLEQAGGSLDGATSFDLKLETISGAVSAEDDGVLIALGVRMPGGSSRYEPKLFASVPADAVAAVSFGGTQGAVDRVQDSVDLDALADRIEEATGVSLDSALNALSGEGVLYVRGADGRPVPEVTVVLAPPDAGETWTALDTLAHRLAEQMGTAVGTVTVDGLQASRLDLDGVDVLYTKLDDETVLVTTAEAGIAAFRAQGDKLASSAAFERAATRVGLEERTSGFVYVDLDGLVPFVQALGGAEALPDDAVRALRSLDSVILQSDGDGDTTRVTGFLRANDR